MKPAKPGSRQARLRQSLRNWNKSVKAQLRGKIGFMAELERHKGNSILASQTVFRRREYLRRYGPINFQKIKSWLGSGFQASAKWYAWYLRGSLSREQLLYACNIELQLKKEEMLEKEAVRFGDVKGLVNDVIGQMDLIERNFRRHGKRQ